MKYIFTSIGLGLALVFTAAAQDKYQANPPAGVHRGTARASSVSAPAATTTHRVAQPTMTTQRNVSTAPFRQHTYTARPRVTTDATVRSDTTANMRIRDRNARLSDQARVRSNVAVNRDRNFQTSGNAAANINVNRNRNVTVTNNWRSSQFSGRQYSAFRDYRRSWHDRNWWTSHHNRIVFVSGGWWYWDAGYWYPAWGYDSSAYYPYDGPIYGYSDLTPDQVVTQVQLQLQRDGYYAGPVDGALGPMTREAIAAFQADHGLAITSTVDEPTLSTLGLS